MRTCIKIIIAGFNYNLVRIQKVEKTKERKSKKKEEKKEETNDTKEEKKSDEEIKETEKKVEKKVIVKQNRAIEHQFHIHCRSLCIYLDTICVTF